MIAELETSRGCSVLIDGEDLDYVCDLNWSMQGTSGYLRPAAPIKISQGDYEKITLANYVYQGSIPRGCLVDHINKDFPESFESDNRKSNLRVTTAKGNAENRRVRADNSLGVEGVYYEKRGKCFRVAVSTKGFKTFQPSFNIKYFNSKEDAFETAKLCQKLLKLLVHKTAVQDKHYNQDQVKLLQEILHTEDCTCHDKLIVAVRTYYNRLISQGFVLKKRRIVK